MKGMLSLKSNEYKEVKDFFNLGATHKQVMKSYRLNAMTTYLIKKSSSYDEYMKLVREAYDKQYIAKKKSDLKKTLTDIDVVAPPLRKLEPVQKESIKPELASESHAEPKIVKELVMVVPDQIPEFKRFTDKSTIYMRGWSDALKAINEIYDQQ